MTPQMRVEHPDGTAETIDAMRSTEIYEFDKVDVCSIFCTRPAANGISLTTQQDEVYLVDGGTDEFGGILRDVLRGGSEVELVVESFQRLALDAERTPPGERYENVPDDTIVQDAIDSVPTLSAGTVEQLDAQTTFVFSHASPAKKIRTVADATGAEVRYGLDKTVDYVDSLGSDNSATTLSPSQQNISGTLQPRREGGDKRVTHLTLVGAGEGESQIQATVVPAADSHDYEGDAEYPNVRRYDSTTWSDGDREIWDARSNTDVTDADLLADQGETLIDEYEQASIEADVTVEDHTVGLGDTFAIHHPDENINRELRAVVVERVLDAEGTRYRCTFSNRWMTRETEDEKQVKAIDRYAMGFEGQSYGIDMGGSRQPVAPGTNYETRVYYPSEVAYEHRLNLRVIGHPYRAYSAGGTAGGLHKHLIEVALTMPGAAADAASINPISVGTAFGFTGDHVDTLTYPEVGEAAP